MRSRLIVFILLFFVLVGATPSKSPPQSPSEPARFGGTLRVRPFSGSVFLPNFDPAGDAEAFLLQQVYDGLVALEKDLTIVPALAEYWIISEQGKKFTFYLRKGVRFHHGRELEAEDIRFSLERLIRKETQSRHSQYFIGKVVGAQDFREGRADRVAGFKVLDSRTFEISWTQPYLNGLYILAADFCKVLPRDLVLEEGKGFFRKPSGTGPFKFGHWLRSPRLDIVGVRLERNPAYYGKKPFLAAIEFSPFYTLDHFLDGQVHIMPYVSSRLAGTDCLVLERESFSTSFLAMSCDRAPLDRPEVRRAIAAAIDKSEIAKAAFRLDMVPQMTNNFIPARLPGFFPADEKQHPDLETARRLLGLAVGNLPAAGQFLALTLYFVGPRTEEANNISRSLREALAGLGIKLRHKFLRSAEESPETEEPFLAFFTWTMDFPSPENIVFPVFLSSSRLNRNLMRYANAEVDALAVRAEAKESWSERISLYQAIEGILNRDLPAIPLFSRQERFALQPGVRGIPVSPRGAFFIDGKEIWLEK